VSGRNRGRRLGSHFSGLACVEAWASVADLAPFPDRDGEVPERSNGAVSECPWGHTGLSPKRTERELLCGRATEVTSDPVPSRAVLKTLGADPGAMLARHDQRQRRSFVG
jgi:hypothetical protein